MKNSLVGLCIGTAALSLLATCRSNQETATYHSIEGEIFGTRYRITCLTDKDPKVIQATAEEELHRIDAIASTWKADSELMRYNRTPNTTAFMLSPELSELLQKAGAIKELTNGAFDAGFSYKQIDLSGIAKGYAVDQVVRSLEEQHQITNCMVEIGGEIKTRGHKPDGKIWNIGIHLPDNPPLIIPIDESSIATSGTHLKGSHIIDPKTGKPAAQTLFSTSVIHPSCTMADALATALYVMGPDGGIEWARENKIQAIFVFEDGRITQVHKGEAVDL